ncbi:iron chaperone [Mucilaginibacter gynuensis]|uniref:Iron chaperone n=1 Tax=Mucilaginibacter gynuensis TaxID=1302236 RepID=A0ABP8G0V5_9SPHI
MNTDTPIPKTIDEYIAQQPEAFRETLTELRAIIKGLVPQATETISYRVPCFKYLYMLVGMGVNKNSCSMYVMSPPLLKQMQSELKQHKNIKVAGSTIHFTLRLPLPLELIQQIVLARVAENELLYRQKRRV